MKLSAYMEQNGLTPDAMAQRVGDCSESAVRKWMYGERVPRADQLRRIFEVTEGAVSANDFVHADQTPSTPTAEAAE